MVAESHAAVRRLFGRVLVQSGAIEKEWAQILAYEYDQRGVAEYSADAVFGVEDSEQLVHDAHRFVERMAHYLTSKGIRLEESQPPT